MEKAKSPKCVIVTLKKKKEGGSSSRPRLPVALLDVGLPIALLVNIMAGVMILVIYIYIYLSLMWCVVYGYVARLEL